MQFFLGFATCFLLFFALFLVEVFLAVSRGKTLGGTLYERMRDYPMIQEYRQRPIIVPQKSEQQEAVEEIISKNDARGQDTELGELLEDDEDVM